MTNLRMQEKIQSGEALDISGCKKNGNGDYILSTFHEDFDYCDIDDSVAKNTNLTGKDKSCCTSPLYQQVIDWFENKGFFIKVWCNFNSEPQWWDYEIGLLNNPFGTIHNKEDDGYDNKYKALDKAIEEALKLI